MDPRGLLPWAIGIWVSLLFAVSTPAVPATNDVFPDGSRIDLAQATRVANNHLRSFATSGIFTLGEGTPVTEASRGEPLYYRFDVQPHGYIVVCASAELPPVIAYSFTTDFDAEREAGDPLTDLLRWDVRSRLDHLSALSPDLLEQRRAAWTAATESAAVPPGGTRFQQWPPSGSTPTGGWVLTRWTQSSPYNNLCPTDPVTGSRSIAGCPAVAMAQIVNYHERLNATHFSDLDDYYHNYSGRRYWIDNDYVARSFPSFPQLNAYLDTLFERYFYGAAPTSTDKAALVFACGVAAQQVYTSSGSGTFGVDQAMDAYEKFGCDTAELLYEGSSGPYPRLAQNMIDGFPAHLAIVNPGWTSGHNLVVDGYNTNGYYHLNFGWGGSYDGWYLLPTELPMSLTVIEGIIVDILVDDCELMDCNCDGTVSTEDFSYLADCMYGPSGTLAFPGCASFDADSDGDVDLADFAVFQRSFDQPAP
ncbi:MAG TPA: C10 family peptidase [Phycisphaerae bacterium]|nr:C10 family peptidase [Phycisphaerae bacterium]HNU46629.1 C10 family peptidase [Phycisphaerae bacterium]